MKKVIGFLTIAACVGYGLAPAETYEAAESLYKRWHQVLDSNQRLTEAMWFQVHGPRELADIVSEIESNRIAMTMFLCEKLASDRTASYADALLLEHVSGIDLLHASDKPIMDQDFAANVRRFAAQFATDWKNGLYENPHLKIAELCMEKLAIQSGDSISSIDVVELRRFGVFGLPELIRQMKRHNSKHAFAAYLIVTGQRAVYADYIVHSNGRFVSREEKIDHAKKKLIQMKTLKGGDVDFIQKAAAALDE